MRNLKLLKVTSCLLTIISAFILTPIKVNAAWMKNEFGWWNTEENSYSVGWRKINEKWYYFDVNGYMKTGWILCNNQWYYMYEDGSMAHDTTIDGYILGTDGSWIPKLDTNIQRISDEDIIKSTFEQLPLEYQKDIPNFKNAQVEKIILNEEIGRIIDKSYIGKEVYLVDFITNSECTPNNVVIYVSIDKIKLIGYGYMD